jgi:hypothetical protein
VRLLPLSQSRDRGLEGVPINDGRGTGRVQRLIGVVPIVSVLSLVGHEETLNLIDGLHADEQFGNECGVEGPNSTCRPG